MNIKKIAKIHRGTGAHWVEYGEPITEPIAWQGPFVMNTRNEIDQALADYRAGRF